MKLRMIVNSTVSVAALFSFLAGLSGCTFLKVNLAEEVQPVVEQTIGGRGRDKILILDINGIIASGDGGAVLGGGKRPSLLARVREELDRARKDAQVKAVIMRINSPGGGVTASDTLYHELKAFKQETGVKIIAHIQDVGASGGYYAALAADSIMAQAHEHHRKHRRHHVSGRCDRADAEDRGAGAGDLFRGNEEHRVPVSPDQG